MRTWNHANPLGPELFVGWVGAALLGAAPSHRAHMNISGERGTGKSLKASLAEACLGPMAHPVQTDATKAGIERAFSGEARAFLMDETEASAAPGQVQKMIEIFRAASGGAGAKVLRGSTGGQTYAFTIVGPALFISILPPPLMPQDRSRITTLELLPLLPAEASDDDRRRIADNDRRVKAAIRRFADHAPALWRRAIDGWPRFEGAFQGYRAGLLGAGCDPRQADQFATLLAGRDLLTSDFDFDPAAAADEIDRFAPMIEAVRTADREQSEGALCFAHLMDARVDQWTGGERVLVGELVARAARQRDREANRKLMQFGIRVLLSGRDRLEPELAVIVDHSELRRVYRDTRWSDGTWTSALRYLPDAVRSRGAVRFGTAQRRATIIPASLLPTELEPPGDDSAAGLAETRATVRMAARQLAERARAYREQATRLDRGHEAGEMLAAIVDIVKRAEAVAGWREPDDEDPTNETAP